MNEINYLETLLRRWQIELDEAESQLDHLEQHYWGMEAGEDEGEIDAKENEIETLKAWIAENQQAIILRDKKIRPKILQSR